jgi:hypothetical protein
MGINYIVSCYSENDPNQFLKYAWRDIQWPAILETLDINITEVDYDSPINYWSPEDVKEMRDRIQAFCDETLWVSEEDQKHMNYLHNDATVLLEFFNYYVANNASIRAF